VIDVARMRALARGEHPRRSRHSAIFACSPVADVAASGVSHCSYSVTGTTGQIAGYREKSEKGPVAEPVAAHCSRPPELEFEADQAEREAIALELGEVPQAYAAAFAQIQAHPPEDIPAGRWELVVNDAGLFLDRWGKQAERLGWTVEDLFGLHPRAPMLRYDHMGLLWTLRGERVVALTATEARLSGGLAYRRRNDAT
jgi:hypothetical protein